MRYKANLTQQNYRVNRATYSEDTLIPPTFDLGILTFMRFSVRRLLGKRGHKRPFFLLKLD